MSNVKKNFAYQSIYQVANIILPLVTSPYVARVLGAKGVGFTLILMLLPTIFH